MDDIDSYGWMDETFIIFRWFIDFFGDTRKLQELSDKEQNRQLWGTCWSGLLSRSGALHPVLDRFSWFIWWFRTSFGIILWRILLLLLLANDLVLDPFGTFGDALTGLLEFVSNPVSNITEPSKLLEFQDLFSGENGCFTIQV